MKVRRLFTYRGKRYEPGDDFDASRMPAWRRDSFVRLYGLEEGAAPVVDEEPVVDLAAMKKSELVVLADEWGVDLPAGATKTDIIELLEVRG